MKYRVALERVQWASRTMGQRAKEKEENFGEELAGCKGLRAEWVMGLGGAQDSLALSLTHAASFSGKTKKRKREKEARVFFMRIYINSAELMTRREKVNLLYWRDIKIAKQELSRDQSSCLRSLVTLHEGQRKIIWIRFIHTARGTRGSCPSLKFPRALMFSEQTAPKIYSIYTLMSIPIENENFSSCLRLYSVIF